MIHEYVKNMFFFRKFKEDLKAACDDDKAIYTIIREMYLERVPEHTEIFSENDPSNNKAYIVLDGTVGIWKKPLGTAFAEDFDKLQALQNKGKMSNFCPNIPKI